MVQTTMWLKVIFASVVLIDLARPQGQTQCIVTEKRTGQLRPCVFPFIVGGNRLENYMLRAVP